jgi:hypothetical protein
MTFCIFPVASEIRTSWYLNAGQTFSHRGEEHGSGKGKSRREEKKRKEEIQVMLSDQQDEPNGSGLALLTTDSREENNEEKACVVHTAFPGWLLGSHRH